MFMSHERIKELFNTVLVRPPAREFPRCVSTHPLRNTVDLNLALKQHEDYVNALQEEGIEVKKLPSLDGFPDSVFIQDTALIRTPSRKALISRFGEPSRRGEEASVREFLEKLGFSTVNVEAPATLEGGDVMVTDAVVFVGLTTRTNVGGVEALKSFFKQEVIAVPTEKVFHLLSAVNYIGNKTVVIVPELVDPQYFRGFKQIRVPLDEAYAANVLYLGENRILMPEGYPRTAEKLRKEGYRTVEVDVSEFRKCDGGVTCLSLPFFLI
jgi:dimethylargininase